MLISNLYRKGKSVGSSVLKIWSKMKMNKKASVAIAIIIGLSAGSIQAATVTLGATNNNFTMLDPGGRRVGGANDVAATWDGTLNTSVESAVVNMTLSSETSFFGVNWFAHDVKVFGPGTYTFETCLADGSKCTGSTPLSMTVGEGQIGAHMLFDWSVNVNIDVVNVWDMNAIWGGGPNDGSSKNILIGYGTDCPTTKGSDLTTAACADFFGTEWFLSSTDDDGDGIFGTSMVDGPFTGMNANFNLRASVVPVPAAVWLFGSGLIGLFSITRRKTK